jgi:GDP/UDP-N,N'-diacetylbacillosamine 2-epimerase (hydrolysing)
MKKEICFVTATRAEYGLLKPLIKRFIDHTDFNVNIVVTGAHLSPEFGMTVEEIEFQIDETIEIVLSSDTPAGITKAMGLGLIGFADYFKRKKIDLLFILGDRYESLAVGIAAANEKIPIAHLYGGETTEGAVDEFIRHALTKMSYFHFTSTEEYRKRVIQLGEHPERVFCVGSLGVENITNEKTLTKKELERELAISLGETYALATFHPVTLQHEEAKNQVLEVLEACKSFPEITFLFTKANADASGRIINQLLHAYTLDSDQFFLVSSLGVKKYLSALEHCKFVIGNSSSGIIEAPSFGVPTINVGDRQKGRIQANSVIDTPPDKENIKKAIEKAMTQSFQSMAKKTTNPYGDGKTSDKIINIVGQKLLQDNIDLMKAFYNITFEI